MKAKVFTSVLMQFEDCWPQMCCHLFIFHVYLTHIERIQKPKFTTGYKRIHIVHIQWMSWSPPLCPGAGPELFQPAQHFKNRFSLPQAWEPLSSESLHSVSIFPRTSVADYIDFFLQILLPALHKHAQTWAVHCCFHFGIHIENLLFILRYINQSKLKKTVISF